MRFVLGSRQQWIGPKKLASGWRRKRSREPKQRTRSFASILIKASESRSASACSSACSLRASSMSETNNGLFASVKRFADLTLATAHNRVELFSVELQEEKCRVVQAILLTAGAIALSVSAL